MWLVAEGESWFVGRNLQVTKLGRKWGKSKKAGTEGSLFDPEILLTSSEILPHVVPVKEVK